MMKKYVVPTFPDIVLTRNKDVEIIMEPQSRSLDFR